MGKQAGRVDNSWEEMRDGGQRAERTTLVTGLQKKSQPRSMLGPTEEEQNEEGVLRRPKAGLNCLLSFRDDYTYF